MPSNSFGFTGNEIVSRVVNYIGNTTTAFSTYVQQTLPLAEFRYCKMHPWRFLYKQHLPLAVTNGNNVYSLDSTTIGYYMAAEDVHTIYDQNMGRVLRQADLKDIRRLDPKEDDGTNADDLTHWAVLNDNQVYLYPPLFKTTTLRVDGYITPTALTDLTQYPTIPYRYQEGFIEYVMALSLDRENDDRALAKQQSATSMIMKDIQSDQGQRGTVDVPRVRHWNEANVDGVGGIDLANFYISWLFFGRV